MRRVVAILLLTAPSLGQSAPSRLTHGPFLGHTSTTSVRVWGRVDAAGFTRLRVLRDGVEIAVGNAQAALEHDLCVTWQADGLAPGTKYEYRIDSATTPIAVGDDLVFTTAPVPGDAVKVRLAFGSCADEGEATAAVWERLFTERPDAVVLLGDTPYIDSTDIVIQRRRYAQFAAVPTMARLLRTTPWYATWDDHDFGANDTDGRLEDKAEARQAFVEYHANPSYGDGVAGVYTSFRRGPVEVFLLDTRWFAATEPSPFRAHAASLLGAAQWRWLQAGLQASTAPFKVLACGMIWNEATRPNKLDHWGSYPHERAALFRFLVKAGIGGVVLVGGDIHRSRVIRHETADGGVPIVELITSPMHGGIIAAANAPHPGLVHDMGEPRSFLLLDADAKLAPPQLRARFMNAAGRELFAYRLF